MDDAVVLDKLDTLQRCVERIKKKTPLDAASLTRDIDAQDIIAVNLERAVQACVDIAARLVAAHNRPSPETMAASFDSLSELGLLPPALAVKMKKVVGFRNIAVHAYKQIDWTIVYYLITQRLDDFNLFSKHVIDIRR
jgi:uncharacterized protein YutE (UPF0331/DUF86 family)